jgi:excisionase family DNA binding protein
LTKKEAAKFLKVSTRTLDRFRAQQVIRAVKLGGKVLFRPEELERVLTHNVEKL